MSNLDKRWRVIHLGGNSASIAVQADEVGKHPAVVLANVSHSMAARLVSDHNYAVDQRDLIGNRFTPPDESGGNYETGLSPDDWQRHEDDIAALQQDLAELQVTVTGHGSKLLTIDDITKAKPKESDRPIGVYNENKNRKTYDAVLPKCNCHAITEREKKILLGLYVAVCRHCHKLA